MYIIHIVVLYFVLLKLRLDNVIPRNFNMIPVLFLFMQTTPSCHGASFTAPRLFEMTRTGTWNRLSACVGIRIEHNPGSGRMVLWKGGVAASGSIPVSGTHSDRWQLGGGATPQVQVHWTVDLCTLICYIYIVLINMIYYTWMMCIWFRLYYVCFT